MRAVGFRCRLDLIEAVAVSLLASAGLDELKATPGFFLGRFCRLFNCCWTAWLMSFTSMLLFDNIEC